MRTAVGIALLLAVAAASGGCSTRGGGGRSRDFFDDLLDDDRNPPPAGQPFPDDNPPPPVTGPGHRHPGHGGGVPPAVANGVRRQYGNVQIVRGARYGGNYDVILNDGREEWRAQFTDRGAFISEVRYYDRTAPNMVDGRAVTAVYRAYPNSRVDTRTGVIRGDRGRLLGYEFFVVDQRGRRVRVIYNHPGGSISEQGGW